MTFRAKMRRTMRGALRSKTFWMSFFLMFFSGLEMYFPRLQDTIDPKYYFPAFFAIGMIYLILRFFTDKSWMDK